MCPGRWPLIGRRAARGPQLTFSLEYLDRSIRRHPHHPTVKSAWLHHSLALMYRIISKPPPRDDSADSGSTPQDNVENQSDELGGEATETAPSEPEGYVSERETSVLSTLSSLDEELPQSADASEVQVLLFGRTARRLLSCPRSRRHNSRTLGSVSGYNAD